MDRPLQNSLSKNILNVADLPSGVLILLCIILFSWDEALWLPEQGGWVSVILVILLAFAVLLFVLMLLFREQMERVYYCYQTMMIMAYVPTYIHLVVFADENTDSMFGWAGYGVGALFGWFCACDGKDPKPRGYAERAVLGSVIMIMCMMFAKYKSSLIEFLR